MPELPDVGGFRRLAEEHCLGRGIAGVSVPNTGSLKGASPATLRKRLEGKSVRSCRRHGKFLFLEVTDAITLAMHFGTNGALQYVARGQRELPYARLWLRFTDGSQLAYINPRRIGHIQLVADSVVFITEARLGPDALDPAFSLVAFTAALAGSKRSVKAVLMDQTRMAGIGNIYSDEILFHARLHPAMIATALDRPRTRRLYESMKSVLRTAIHSGAGAEHFTERLPEGFLLPERRTGGQCPRCGTDIQSYRRGGRTAYYCPQCQPKA